ncbi:MAG: NirD/YgiW/YdeI family stress tolerance protein [Burkholderiaceae bacterium]|nr:NirD/YgiW/YdeI family stress tolerance protein [Burkholderiaceae bacterium]
MLRLTSVLIWGVCVAFGMAGIAHAQYSGPGTSDTSLLGKLKGSLKGESESGKAVTVKQLKKKPVYDEDVYVKGKLVKKTGKKEYQFRDDTGTLTAVIADNLFEKREVSDTTLVELRGRLKKAAKSLLTKEPRMEVSRLKVLRAK